jgi:hypothetical protein
MPNISLTDEQLEWLENVLAYALANYSENKFGSALLCDYCEEHGRDEYPHLSNCPIAQAERLMNVIFRPLSRKKELEEELEQTKQQIKAVYSDEAT